VAVRQCRCVEVLLVEQQSAGPPAEREVGHAFAAVVASEKEQSSKKEQDAWQLMGSSTAVQAACPRCCRRKRTYPVGLPLVEVEVEVEVEMMDPLHHSASSIPDSCEEAIAKERVYPVVPNY